MKLHYYRSRHGNFGDDLNTWIWPELLPGVWDNRDDDITFVGIGTILNNLVPDTRLKIVLSSGVGYSPIPRGLHDGSWKVLAVRGPLSARAAGLPAEAAVTDGAILLGTLPGMVRPATSRDGGVVFVPHVSSAESGAWEVICARLGITYVDPRWDFRRVFSLIGNARLVLADAMHGAIVADTFRVPWVPLVSSREISSFKWMDWTRSLEMPYRPRRLPASSLPEAIRDRFVPAMGRDYLDPAVFAPDRSDTGIDDALLEKLGKTSIRESTPRWQHVNRTGTRLWRRLGQPASEFIAGNGLQRIDARYTDKATEALGAAVNAPAFLSDDRVYENRRSRLMDAVEATRRIYDGYR